MQEPAVPKPTPIARETAAIAAKRMPGMPMPVAKPMQKQKIAIDLLSLTELLEDPYVDSLEYENGKLIVISREGEREHFLSEEEAKKIVENFANAANISAEQPFEATVSGLKMSAVISEVLGTRFLIEKVS